MSKKITVAKTAGFCFGVSRAVNIVEKLLDDGKKVCTLGPIIHNKQMVQNLEKRGARIVEAPEEVNDDETLVIRSHGVPKSIINRIEKLNVLYEDATCPFVKKIHNIVSEHSENGDIILIAGDEKHPEVQGIIGFCKGEYHVFKNSEELEKIFNDFPYLEKNSVCVVVQTTFDILRWKILIKDLQNRLDSVKIFSTICSATSNRQNEAKLLSENSDLIIVVGGKHSSNTNKLFDICKKSCVKTCLIETAAELPLDAVSSAGRIGITAGASTPATIIQEVIYAMSEEIKNGAEPQAEPDFKELLEESLKSYNTDGRIKGTVVRITPTEVQVDVGRKQTGIIPLSELSADPTVKAEDIVKVGDELELIIMKTNDQEGTILLSKRLLDAQKGWDEIAKAKDDETVLHGVVSDVIKGGVIVVSNNVRVFIPASLTAVSRGTKLDTLLKKEVDYRIIEVNRQRRRAVGSIRAVVDDERKKFWDSIEVGKVYSGVVKSITSYGAFVDIGGIDGMVHISELSWERIKHPSDVVKVGDNVEVYIKSFEQENGKAKISLGYKKAEDNPWEVLRNDYPVGTVCDAKIVSLTTFGAFARILPGIEGLIHVSQISKERIEKPEDVLSIGQNVKVKIVAIDFEKKRVSLSIKEADSEPVDAE